MALFQGVAFKRQEKEEDDKGAVMMTVRSVHGYCMVVHKKVSSSLHCVEEYKYITRISVIDTSLCRIADATIFRVSFE